MSGCACQQVDVIDWDAINRSLSNRVEVNVDSDDVLRVIDQLKPVLRAGIRAGLKAQAKFVAEAAIRRMTGRLD